jgi:hypothetical protein
MMAAVARNVTRAAISSGLSIPALEGGGAKKYRRHKVAAIATAADETKSPVNETTATIMR